ncbi:MAG TPA: P-II family nitrogen regulator [Candidatus Omnitrophota bacterium]|nr:P-II family nitrogen regulator [Candidatus Omnitrophota bacterium]
MSEKGLCDLVVTIVNKGDAEKVVEFSKRAGAGGGTIFFARGTGGHDQVKLFGISIEPEKEIVLTLVESWKTDKVLSSISEGLDLEKPGKGIAFVINAGQVAGYVPKISG